LIDLVILTKQKAPKRACFHTSKFKDNVKPEKTLKHLTPYPLSGLPERGIWLYNYLVTKFKTIIKARYLRREKTKAEKILWEKLRNKNLGVRFRRQHPVDMFILDFYAPEIELAIELDGSIHKMKENKEYDKERENYLRSKYIEVIRFWNSEVETDLENTLKTIKEKIQELSSI